MLRTSLLLAAAAPIARLLRHAAPSTRHLLWHVSIVLVLLAPDSDRSLPHLMCRWCLRFQGCQGGCLWCVPCRAKRWCRVAAMSTRQLKTRSHQPLRNSWQHWHTWHRCGLGWFLFCWLLSGFSVWRGSRPAPPEWIEAEGSRSGGSARSAPSRAFANRCATAVRTSPGSSVGRDAAAAGRALDGGSATGGPVHEFTHIRRGDRRTQAMAQLACAIYWFNPLVWYAARRSAASANGRVTTRCCGWARAVGVRDAAARPRALPLAVDAGHRAEHGAPSAIEGRLLMILADAVEDSAPIVALARHRRHRRGRHGDSRRAAGGAAQLRRRQAVREADRPEVVRHLGWRRRPAPSRHSPATFVEALERPNGQVREHAAMALALTPGDDVIDPLLER